MYTYDGDIWVGLMTVKEAIEHAAGLDVEGIEFFDKMHLPNYPHPTAYDLLGLKEYVEFFGMAVSCYSFYIDTLIHSEKKATFEEEGKQVKDALGAAKVLGAKIVRVAEQAGSLANDSIHHPSRKIWLKNGRRNTFANPS